MTLTHAKWLCGIRARLPSAESQAEVVEGDPAEGRFVVRHEGPRGPADIEIAGQTIGAGEGVILLGELANRDPLAFEDPDRPDVTRDARRHQAFGGGTHHCIGQPLARLELQVLYPALLRRIPTLRAEVPPEETRFKYDAVIYGLHELPASW